MKKIALATARASLRLSIPAARFARKRPGRELNPRIRVLQTPVLPLHHRALYGHTSVRAGGALQVA